MSKKIHSAPRDMVSVLESSDGFEKITGTADFARRAKAALKVTKNTKVYNPDTDSGGFGSRPSFSVGSGFETIKSDPDAYTKILSGSSRKSSKQVAQYSNKALTRKHRPKRPKVDPEVVAKYSRKRAQPKQHVARATPSVALVYSYGPRSLSLRPQYSLAFKGVREATQALKRGEILSKSLVHFLTPNRDSVFTEAYRLALYFHS